MRRGCRMAEDFRPLSTVGGKQNHTREPHGALQAFSHHVETLGELRDTQKWPVTGGHRDESPGRARSALRSRRAPHRGRLSPRLERDLVATKPIPRQFSR